MFELRSLGNHAVMRGPNLIVNGRMFKEGTQIKMLNNIGGNQTRKEDHGSEPQTNTVDQSNMETEEIINTPSRNNQKRQI